MNRKFLNRICICVCFVICIIVGIFIAKQINVIYKTATENIAMSFYEQYNELVEKFINEIFSLDSKTNISYLI